MLSDFATWLSDFFISLVAYVFIKLADLISFILGLLPTLPPDAHPLSYYLSGISADIINLLAYMQLPAMLSVVVAAYLIRAGLMILGR